MKKHILPALSLILCCFIFGGFYVYLSIGDAADKLDKVSTFHQVEFLQDELARNIRDIQSDLLFTQSAQPTDIETQNNHLDALRESGQGCLTCHHSDETKKLLDDLWEESERYLTLAGNSMKSQTDQKEQSAARMLAFSRGEKLLSAVTSLSFTSGKAFSTQIDIVRADMRAANIALISFLIIASIFVVLITRFYLKRLAGSIDILTEASRNLGNGDLDYRISQPISGELGCLAHSINSMADSIQQRINEIQADDELQHTDQMTLIGQMAAGLAHEIKNPLAGIKVSLDVLGDELDLQADDKEVFALIINDINRVERVLKSLLFYARPPKPQLDLVDINQLLDNSVMHTEAAFGNDPEKKIDFEKEFASDLSPVEVDSSQFQQVFQNILSNSIEAMKSGGRVSIATRATVDGGVRIEISDTGPGISSEMAERIFTPFFTTKRKGTGLGLSISKRLVEQHGCTIINTDNRSGEGSAFWITIPPKSNGVINEQ